MFEIPHYPHLKEYEAIIWERALNSKIFDGTFAYDVRVGEGFHENHEGECKTICDDFKMLTQKRIDVVNENDEEIKLIEITPKLSSRVLGQSFVYSTLYKQKFNPEKPIKSFVVVETLDDDLLPIFNANAITVLTV